MIALLSGLALALSAASVRGFLAVSRRRFLDAPGARSSHVRPTPTGGGFPALAVFICVAGAGVLLGAVTGGPRWWAALLCAGVLALLGLVDDARGLPRFARYAVHALVAVAIVHWVGHPGPSAGPWAVWSYVASVVFVTGLINAFNFMDGIDALVGGTGVVIVTFLAWFTRDALWILLAATYSGFLVFNAPPARIFMGDAGSTALGGLVGVALLSGRTTLETRHLLILVPLIGDSSYTIVRRLIRRENIFKAHHSHIYQRLLRAGHTHGWISGWYAAATFALGLLVLSGNRSGVLVGAVACGLAVVPLEVHLARRGVPFTRPRAPRAAGTSA